VGLRAVAGKAPRARAQTKHIRLYVEIDVDPAREREMLDLFHSQFVPKAVKHEAYMRVKLLKRRTILQGTAPASRNYRFERPHPNSMDAAWFEW
jgi:hypothetical protein